MSFSDHGSMIKESEWHPLVSHKNLICIMSPFKTPAKLPAFSISLSPMSAE